MQRFFAILAGLLVLATASPAFALSPSVSRFETSPDGQFVTQTIEFQLPAVYHLSFRFVDPVTNSGPDDPLRDCHAGWYSYNFGGDVPIYMTLPPLSGSTATKVFAKTGSVFGVPSHYGYFDPSNPGADTGFDTGLGLGAIFSHPPVVEKDGSMSFSFHETLPSELLNTLRTQKPGCYIPPDIAEKYNGQTYDNSYTTRYKIAVVWRLDDPGQVMNTTQTIEVNGQPQTLPASYGKNGPTIQLTPDAALINAIGHATPSNPATGLTGQDLVTVLTAEGYALNLQTDMGTITSRLTKGESALAWVTATAGGQPQSGAILVTGYNGQRDSFQVTDTSTGRPSNIPYNHLMSQNPNFNFITAVK